jgi:cytochrome bd-type quinol oxidase subunit 2
MTIFRRNNLNIGIGLGIFVPLVVFGVLFGIVNAGLPLKIRTIALIALCANGLIVRTFRQNRAGDSVRGVVMTTVALAALWIFNFYQEISAEWAG